MPEQLAHDLNAKWRSDDVATNEENNFASFHLDERILAGLSKAGYRIPSPVQLEAIPLCLTGCDVFVQGKAGTGKTLIFSILALTKVLEADDQQVLIVAPTREGAFQIFNTINAIGCEVKDLKCECFIGGFSFVDDIPKAKNCNIAVGTPGRINHLIHEEKLKVDTICLFVIDDIDELLNKHMRPEVTDIFDTLPVKIQTVVMSLTCVDEVLQLASEYLKDPHLACYCEKRLPSLLGMAHYYHIVPFDFLPVLAYRKKLKVLKDILLRVKFSQCIIFSNSVHRVELLCVDVKSFGLSVATMTKAMDQVERLQVLELLKKNKCKVFISTDVGSRALDAENVDLVVNFDIPPDSRSYLHRCGRAGRYGSKCSSVTFLLESQDKFLIDLENEEHLKSYVLPEPIPEDLNCDKHPSKVTSLQCKPSISNMEMTKVRESCLIPTANLEILDTNNSMSDFERVKPDNEFAEDSEDTAKIKARKPRLVCCRERHTQLSGNVETRVTWKKKICDKNYGNIYKMPTSLTNCVIKPHGQIKSHERQVIFSGLKTTSESDADQSSIKFYSGCQANHLNKKTICAKCNIESKCGKCLEQGNSFPGRKISVNRHCSSCQSRPCCPSYQHCSFQNYKNWQHQEMMHRDMFYKQLKFINDFSYFLSYLHK